MTPITDPAEEYFKDGLWGWDAAAQAWIKVTASSGKLQVETMPELHADTHEDGGTDEINVAGLSGELADDQPTKAHNLGGAKHSADTLANLNTKVSDATLDDSSATRTPSAHKASHQDGGADEIDVADLGSGAATDDHVATADGAGGVAWEAPPTAGLYNAYVCVRDKKAQNTGGGTFTSGAWRTRDINDEQADPQAICSIASNQITLAAGTYRCLISAPAYRVDHHQARLYNITDSSVLLVGTSASSQAAEHSPTLSLIIGRFTLAAQKTLEIQHRCDTTYADFGFGLRANFADEIYTVAEFYREA